MPVAPRGEQALAGESGKKRNRLAAEESPYLLKHAENPVDWYPWGGEALAKAKNDNKPIFLSIGYSTCHWCTVMERESFEDEKTAAFINKNFLAIKVDREERPEVDAYYMGAVQAMTGGGGWPLSVFLTPELKPFYGGTYFPPEPRLGMPSFMQVLEFVSTLWKEKRGEVVTNAGEVFRAISRRNETLPEMLPRSVLDEGYAGLMSTFDQQYGGFGVAPKFPLPSGLAFLLRYHHRTGKELARSSVLKTLDAMMAGGIRDHLAGGFHRYSTDRVWLVPHFEKMLYDNALLARVYADAYQATRRQEYAEVVEETLGWVSREMRDRGGGFYSAQDADTVEGEGTYYTWTPEEVTTVLGQAKGERFDRAYGVTKAGNFDGRSILHLGPGAGQTERAAGEDLAKMYAERLRRPRPAIDTKVLTSWNGLAISAFAVAGQVLGKGKYIDYASVAARSVLRANQRSGRLLRMSAGGEGGLEGTLEDYAFLVQGLLDLFEATGEPRWLEESVRLTGAMIDGYEDREQGGFYLTLDAVPARLKEGYDGPTPSGNSVAALDLVRLSELTGEGKYRQKGEETIRYFGRDVEDNPAGHACMLMALDLLTNGVREIVISARDAKASNAMREVVHSRFMPDRVLMVTTEKSHPRLLRLSRLVDRREPSARPRAFVCQNLACKLPADSPEALEAQLSGEG